MHSPPHGKTLAVHTQRNHMHSANADIYNVSNKAFEKLRGVGVGTEGLSEAHFRSHFKTRYEVKYYTIAIKTGPYYQYCTQELTLLTNVASILKTPLENKALMNPHQTLFQIRLLFVPLRTREDATKIAGPDVWQARRFYGQSLLCSRWKSIT